MSWFRSSRRRRDEEPRAEEPAVAVRDRPSRAELDGRHLADLHALAREAALPRYRLLRREELIGVLSGEPAPAGATAVAPVAAAPAAFNVDEARTVSNALVDRIGALMSQLSSSAPAPSAADLEQITRGDATTLLVATEGDGTVVGALTLVVFRIPTGVRAWIEDVVVDERARGRGVGEALTREALRRARERGARTVDLTSRPQREAANRMYGRIGFQRRETHVYRLET